MRITRRANYLPFLLDFPMRAISFFNIVCKWLWCRGLWFCQVFVRKVLRLKGLWLFGFAGFLIFKLLILLGLRLCGA